MTLIYHPDRQCLSVVDDPEDPHWRIRVQVAHLMFPATDVGSDGRLLTLPCASDRGHCVAIERFDQASRSRHSSLFLRFSDAQEAEAARTWLNDLLKAGAHLALDQQQPEGGPLRTP